MLLVSLIDLILDTYTALNRINDLALGCVLLSKQNPDYINQTFRPVIPDDC